MAALIASAVLALASFALCLFLARRDDKRFSGFERVPAKFSLPGHPAELMPRKLVLYLTPALFGMLLVFVGGAVFFSAPERGETGGLAAGMLVMAVTFPAISRLFTVIVERWVRDQKG